MIGHPRFGLSKEERYYIQEAVAKSRDIRAAFAFLRGQMERGWHVIYAVKQLRRLNERGAI